MEEIFPGKVLGNASYWEINLGKDGAFSNCGGGWGGLGGG